MEEKGFWADKIILLIALFTMTAVTLTPLISAAVAVTATVGNAAPNVFGIQICDGTCGHSKSITPGVAFTLQVDVNDPNGDSDVNTESFRVTLYHATDTNSASEDWDHNSMTFMDDNLALGTFNGCTQDNNTYCITIPALAWTTKFLLGDVNIYVAVDDNGADGTSLFDSNHVDANALTANATVGRSEDATSGTYSGTPGIVDIAITANTTNAYTISTHNGNTTIDVTIAGSDLNVSATQYIGDGNQSWHPSDDAGSSTAFTGSPDTVKSSWTRGTSPNRPTQNTYLWLDIPDQQGYGAYTGTLTYGSAAS